MSRDAYNPEYTYLAIAEAGCYANAPNRFEGEIPASVTIPDNRLSCYYGDVVEGGTIMDKRPAFQRNDSACVRAVYSGPMLQDNLPALTLKRCQWMEGDQLLTADSESVIMEEEGFFLKSGGQRIKLSAFDHLSLDLYCQLWRQLGARVGKRVGMTIRWEDGEDELIRPESERWKLGVK